MSSPVFSLRLGLAALAAIALAGVQEIVARADTPGEQTATERRSDAEQTSEYRSRNFLLHTDLPDDQARALLERLETTLGSLADYFGRPPEGVIECFVVEDLQNWPAESLPPDARVKIAQRAGVTTTEVLRSGETKIAAKSIVYAKANNGTAEHEIVHAYFGQTFGSRGPLWFAEGMAEMGQYWQPGDTSVRCHRWVEEHIRSQPVRSLKQVLDSNAITGDSWQDYSWRWALCHMLVHNPNYSAKFRALGLSLLTDQKVTFQDVYGPILGQLEFEYRFFLEHLSQGYRVDLCAWDWKTRFVALEVDRRALASIQARRGWQATGALVSAGQMYRYTARGAWQTGSDAPHFDARGDATGRGRLVAVVFDEFQLSEPFELSTAGTFTPPGDGQLFVRCQDEWNQLADNAGEIRLEIDLARESPIDGR